MGMRQNTDLKEKISNLVYDSFFSYIDVISKLYHKYKYCYRRNNVCCKIKNLCFVL